jgi:hypothetical protein
MFGIALETLITNPIVMTRILKPIFSLATLALSFSLVSMTPDKGVTPAEIKFHVTHGGQTICLTKSAYEAHTHNHVGKVDCTLTGLCMGGRAGHIHR